MVSLIFPSILFFMSNHNVLGQAETVSFPPTQNEMPSEYIGSDAVWVDAGECLGDGVCIQRDAEWPVYDLNSISATQVHCGAVGPCR